MAAQVLEFICKHFWSVLPFFGPEIHLWTFTRRDLFSFISVVVPNSGQPGKRWLSIWIHRFILIHPLVFDPGHFEAPISPIFWWQLQLTDRWLDRPLTDLVVGIFGLELFSIVGLTNQWLPWPDANLRLPFNWPNWKLKPWVSAGIQTLIYRPAIDNSIPDFITRSFLYWGGRKKMRKFLSTDQTRWKMGEDLFDWARC